MAQFSIAHLYPDLMNLYGDRGNLICLQKRLQWRGHQCSIENLGLSDDMELGRYDMVFMGGGSDREQGLVYEDLLRKGSRIMEQIEAGLPMLCICGAYQLLGQSYIAADGQVMDGLRFFNFRTVAGSPRLIGNILIEANIDGQKVSVVGFENHGGRTIFLDHKLQPLGHVIKGFGNNGKDGGEGLIYKNLIGTYLHGPFLPKNPAVADFILSAMAKRRGVELDTLLDDSIEKYAHDQVKDRLLGSSR
ncbi:MAG: glutamine amidotransferase [Syntrophomonadaceae bacterium]|nr:glutamine amidotransferase [Syntrophomonadaceae bacterium]